MPFCLPLAITTYTGTIHWRVAGSYKRAIKSTKRRAEPTAISLRDTLMGQLGGIVLRVYHTFHKGPGSNSREAL